MMFVRVRAGDGELVFSFEKDQIMIGRARTNDLVLDHESIDETQAHLQRRGAQYHIIDCSHSRPTLVNGQRLLGMDVGESDVIRLGEYEIQPLQEMPGRPPSAVTEATFNAKLAEDPSDDATRAIYADWFEERGRNQEAEYLRLQLAIKPLEPGALSRRHSDPRMRPAEDRLRELARLLPSGFRMTVARTLLDNCGAAPGSPGVVCPQRWDLLALTERRDERQCRACGKTVYYLRDMPSAQKRVKNGEVVVVDAGVWRRNGDLRPDEERMRHVDAMAQPCLSIRHPEKK